MNYKNWLDKRFNKHNDWVLITGASSGIGLEYLRMFSSAGCNCIIISNELEIMNKIVQEFSKQYDVKIKPFFCDLSQTDSVKSVCKDIEKNYSVKVLINNAGFGLKGKFLDIDLQRYLDIVAVNSTAQTIFSHYFLPAMIKSSLGLHISVATINVVSPIPFNTVYTATKFYVFAYALAVSQEYKDTGVVFQVVLPGTTNTPFHIKQGSKPSAMTMQPDIVVQKSLNDVSRLICIPNRIDAFLYVIASFLPIRTKMSLSAWIAKKRLGLG